MDSRSRASSVAGLLLLALGLGMAGDGQANPISDRALAPYQDRLLEIAFKAASSLPLDPHLKNRSRMQEAVVDACFELDQPRRALRYVEKIDNWRKGIGYGDYAFYCVKHGDTSEVANYLELARKIAESHNGEDAQDWERDRILATIASTQLLLGQTKEATQIAAKLESSESGKVDTVKATLSDGAAADQQLEAMDHLVLAGTFDQIQYALESCARLVDRFYDDAERRPRIEKKIRSSWAKLPRQIQLDLMLEIAGFALDHKDPANALAWINEAASNIDSTRWATEDQVPLKARVAALRFRAGEKERAKVEADAALALFDAQREKIVNIYRAKTLRSIAEAYQAMGETGMALRTYIRAIDAGMENPNSRPRAEDLSATCTSMAQHGVTPDGQLWDHITDICDHLGPPW